MSDDSATMTPKGLGSDGVSSEIVKRLEASDGLKRATYCGCGDCECELYAECLGKCSCCSEIRVSGESEAEFEARTAI